MTRHEAQALERAIGADIDRTPALRDAVLVGGVEAVSNVHTSSSAGSTSTAAAEYRVRLLLVHPGKLPNVVASRAEWEAVKLSLLQQRHLTSSQSR